jgi:hypothetical protein
MKGTTLMAVSEVAALRQRITDEFQAAQWGLAGLASGTSRHTFITRRMEQMGEILQEFTQVTGSEDEAMEMVNETIEAIPDTPTRSDLVDLLRRVLANTEENALLIDYIEEMWETIDLLVERFGPERAKKIINMPSSLEPKGEQA